MYRGVCLLRVDVVYSTSTRIRAEFGLGECGRDEGECGRDGALSCLSVYPAGLCSICPDRAYSLCRQHRSSLGSVVVSGEGGAQENAVRYNRKYAGRPRPDAQAQAKEQG